MSRFTPPDDACLTELQRTLKQIVATPRAEWPGPFNALSRIPDIGISVHDMLRHFATAHCLSEPVREVAILTVAKALQCDYGWHAHVPLALSFGVPREAIVLLGCRNAAAFEDGDMKDATSYTQSLMENRPKVPPRKVNNEFWLIELTALVGLYRMLFQLVNIDCLSPNFSGIPL